MRIADNWKDYKIIDTSNGEKLERWGNTVLIRPDPQIIWNTPHNSPLWDKNDGHYKRSSSGGGKWNSNSVTQKEWVISYKDLKFYIRPTGFKHTGLFPEQAVNWDYMRETIKNSHKNPSDIKILNLFAYTGGATLACAAEGANVCHVDASKGMVAWARDNARLSSLDDKPIRWIVDDCKKFVEREIRRGNRYDGIIMDPPSYGRGPSGETWKLEENIYDFVKLCANLLSDEPLFFILNSYTTGLSPSVMLYLLGTTVANNKDVKISADEIGLPVESTGLILPCGSTAIAQF